MNCDNQSIKRMIRSGYFGHYSQFTAEDIKRNAREVEVPVTYFTELIRQVQEEIERERQTW